MTELQLNGAQMAIDALTAVSPLVIVLSIGIVLIKIMVKFITGRGL